MQKVYFSANFILTRFIITMSLLVQKQLKKVPDYLCYRNSKSSVYVLAAKDGKIAGRMVAMPEFLSDTKTYYPDKKDCYSLYIKRLFVEKNYRSKGAGTALLNIAAKDSYRRHCSGNVHLIAQALEQGNHPHKFYRKYGFDSQSKYHIDLIDNAIKNNTELPPARWCIPMFLPR